MNVKHRCLGAILCLFHDKSMHFLLTGIQCMLFSYSSNAVLFRPQFSFTTASEIHAFRNNFFFCNRNLSIFFV